MNYDEFRKLWHETLEAANLFPFPPSPSETVDVRWLSRAYSIFVALGGGDRARPFHVTARLGWLWDAELAARSTTTEEDLLINLLGQDGYYLVTEQPWLRVDLTLNATLPMDSPLPMPDGRAWRRWAAEVTSRLAPILPIDSEEDIYGLRVLSSRSEPEAELRCNADGHLFLTAVRLPAWQGIDLPRQWNNPDRQPDDWPERQLADFAGRVRQALHEWEGCLRHLHAQVSD